MHSRFMYDGLERFGYTIIFDKSSRHFTESRDKISFQAILFSDLPDLIDEDFMVAWDRDGMDRLIRDDIIHLSLFRNKGFIEIPRFHHSDGVDSWYLYPHYAYDNIFRASAAARYEVVNKIFRLDHRLNDGLGDFLHS